MRTLLAAVLLGWAAPAGAAKLCGAVSVLGRALPDGLLTLSAASPGAAERSFVPIRDGRFCAEDVGRGEYLVWVSPLGWKDAMPLRFEGLEGSATSYRLVVGEGRARVVDARGKTRAAGEPKLAFLDEPPADDWVTVKGQAVYPSSAPAKSGEPGLVLLQTHAFDDIGNVAMSFHWLPPGKPGQSVPFELRVRPGLLRNVFFRSRDFTIAGTDPPTHTRRANHTIALKAAQDFPFRLQLAPIAQTLEGQIKEADGRPFRPYVGAGVEKRRWAELRVLELDNSQQFYLTSDEEGRYRVDLPAGYWEIVLWVYTGRGVYLDSLKTGPMTLLRVRPGGTGAPDFKVPRLAEVSLDKDALPLDRPPERGTILYPQFNRSLFAFPPGALDPGESHEFFVEDYHTVHLTQGHDGFWKRNFYDKDQGEGRWFKAAAGKYDLYAFDADQSAEPYVIMRAYKGGVDLAAGGRTRVEFAKDELFPYGGAELKGTIKASLKAGPGDLDGPMEKLALISAPYLNFYDARGRLAAVAAAQVPRARLIPLFRAMDAGQTERIRTLLYEEARPVAVRGLAPGRYRVQAVAFGYPPKELSVELKEGETARLDVDMDR